MTNQDFTATAPAVGAPAVESIKVEFASGFEAFVVVGGVRTSGGGESGSVIRKYLGEVISAVGAGGPVDVVIMAEDEEGMVGHVGVIGVGDLVVVTLDVADVSWHVRVRRDDVLAALRACVDDAVQTSLS